MKKHYWKKPDSYVSLFPTLFSRSLKPENKKRLSEACSATIDFLQGLRLEKWERYLVVKTLFEEFPMDELLKEEAQKQ